MARQEDHKFKTSLDPTGMLQTSLSLHGGGGGAEKNQDLQRVEHGNLPISIK